MVQLMYMEMVVVMLYDDMVEPLLVIGPVDAAYSMMVACLM